MYYSDNPVADFERYDADQRAKLDKLPKCDHCGLHIQEEHFYRFVDENICEQCLNDNFRVWTEDFTDN